MQVLLLFFVLVGIHEWGHFYFAKRAGILVREFAIGFGPKLFSIKRSETRYTIRLFPIGGFVRMAGEDPEQVTIQPGQTIAIRLNEKQQVSELFLDQLEKRTDVIKGIVQSIDLERNLTLEMIVDNSFVTYSISAVATCIAKGEHTQIAPLNRQFNHKPVLKRAISIFMGPIMNFVLAIGLFAILVAMVGVYSNVKLLEVNQQDPAGIAGLQVGDVIISVNNDVIGDDRDKLIALISESPNTTMSWLILRNNEQLIYEVTPKDVSGKGKVGVSISGDKRDASLVEIVTGTYRQVLDSTKNILTGFKMLVLGQFKIDDLGGPVRTTQVTIEFAKKGLDFYIFWGATLSLYLGLFNLLPFPALDGSRLVFLAIEAIRKKPIHPNRESMVHFIGFATLMLLMVAVTYNDILRFFTK